MFLCLRLAAIVYVTVFFQACASNSGLKKIEDVPLLPKEVRKDLEKFEIHETVATPILQSNTPEKFLKSSELPRKKKKKKPVQAAQTVEKKTASVTSLVFEYPNRRPPVDPIWLNEKAIYDINYLGMNAGNFSLEVMPFKTINDRKVYHIHGEARSNKVFSLFYSLHDTIETFIDYHAFAPHRFHIVLDESKQKRNSLELYDSEKKRSFFWNRWNHHKKGYVEIKDFFPMEPLSQDSLSSLYYLRTIDFVDGGVYRFPVISEGKNWEAQVTVVRREVIKTPLGKMKTIVLKPETKYQGILKKQGDSFIWLSDDDRKILVRLEAKVKIGSVVGSLRSFEPGQKPQQESEPSQAGQE